MATRADNEKNFPNWVVLQNGGRRYWRDYPGRQSGWARYVKIVDANEITIALNQEIYDRNGNLIELHEKFPIDKGHRRV